MKIVFAGSPAYAVPALEALHKKFGISAVITQPDKPVGRKAVMTPTAVKTKATELGLPVYEFVKIRDCVEELKSLDADILITCAYGQILSEEVLESFPAGVWNLHASLLPEFRGASPIQSAICAGKSHTGVTVMRTEISLDTGGILLVKRCEIGDKTYGELQDALSLLSAEAAVEAVGLLNDGNTQLLIQDEAKATYCKKIQKNDAKINFGGSADDICRLIRAMNPQPVAFCEHNGSALNIFSAEISEADGEIGTVICADKRGFTVKCGTGAILVTEVQPAAGKRMRAGDFVNGRKIKAGDRFD